MGKCMFMRKGEIHTNPKAGLPSGYTMLAYIQSSGTQYINTTFKQNQDSRVVMDLQITTLPTSSYAWLFEGRDNGPTNRHSVYCHKSSGTWYGGYGSGLGTTGVSYNINRVLIDFDKNIIKINGETTTTFSEKNFQSETETVLFSCNTGGTLSYYLTAKLYSCQIYDNGTLVRDFVPCINASGEVGLYDLVGKQFYGNAGTGVFTGSEVA